MAFYNGREYQILAVVHNDYPQVKVIPVGSTSPEIVRLDHLELTEEEAKKFEQENRPALNIRKETKAEAKTNKAK